MELETNNFAEELTTKMIADLHKQREKLLFDRLLKLGIEIDIKTEERRRFKSLSKEYKGDKETIYYNDGSERGLRIITFVTKQLPFDVNNMSMSCETSYY